MPLTRVYSRIRELERDIQRWEESVPPGSLRSDHLYNEQVSELNELKNLVRKATKKSILYNLIDIVKNILAICLVFMMGLYIVKSYLVYHETMRKGVIDQQEFTEIMIEQQQIQEQFQTEIKRYCILRKSNELLQEENLKNISDTELQMKMMEINKICDKLY